MAGRALGLVAVAACACCSGLMLASCTGSPGSPLRAVPLGTGLVVRAAPEATTTPGLTVLARRQKSERGERRAELQAVAGRFARIESSAGVEVCGEGVAALLYVDLDAREVRRVIRFTAPAPGAANPTVAGAEIHELEPDRWGNMVWTDRPPYAVVTVSGLFSGVDAAPTGTIPAGVYCGAVVYLDLWYPERANVLALQGAPDAAPLTFGTATADAQVERVTVQGEGHYIAALDLLGFRQEAEGRALRAVLNVRDGSVYLLSAIGGPEPAP